MANDTPITPYTLPSTPSIVAAPSSEDQWRRAHTSGRLAMPQTAVEEVPSRDASKEGRSASKEGRSASKEAKQSTNLFALARWGTRTAEPTTSSSSALKKAGFANKKSSSRFVDLLPDDEDSDHEVEVGKAKNFCPCISEFCARRKEKRRCTYYLFLFVFMGFLIIFPLFLKWLVTSPVPREWWNEDYPTFPALKDLFFIMDTIGAGYDMKVSDIPTSWHSCNHSCSGSTTGQDGAEMSFPVSMSLDAPGFGHTAYPLLLVSADFTSWWVATDRRDSSPTKFFPSHDSAKSNVYHTVSEECSRPPKDLSTIKEPADTVLSLQEGYGSVPIYMMVCVSWKLDSISWQSNATHMTAEDVAEHCQAVGGVCGWPCGANPLMSSMPGCPAGIMSVDTTADSIAGVTLPRANFSGAVTLRACDNGPFAEACYTTEKPMAQWPCHKCSVTSMMFDVETPDNIQGKVNQSFQLTYHSLPKMEVLLEKPDLGLTDAIPRAYIMTSTVDPLLRGPAGLYDGTWRKLYFEYNMIVSDPYRYPMPSPVEPASAPASDEATPAPTAFDPEVFYNQPMKLDATKHEMSFMNKQEVTLNSESCFAARGPLYMVACAMNMSQYEELLTELEKGQAVAPPPFNDRCLAVIGKCGYACASDQANAAPALQHCNADGSIPMRDLFDSNFELPTNEPSDPIVFMFLISLIFGFSVKLMTYLPGLFVPDKHPQHYNSVQTDLFKYIATVSPSGGESKACVLRNLVGCVSALPLGCKCPYHVVYADEGHRHAHKILFRALVKVLEAVPDGMMMKTGSRRDGMASPRPIRTSKSTVSHKEENLKVLTKQWTEFTRLFTLKDCETGKMAAKLPELEQKGKQDEIKKINGILDTMSGLTALRRLQENAGWPTRERSTEIETLEENILRLREELAAPEKKVAHPEQDAEGAVPLHLDDTEAYAYVPGVTGKGQAVQVGGRFGFAPDSDEEDDDDPKHERIHELYTLHYVARARPEEDERTLKVQHIARGIWYYRIPKDEEERKFKTWKQWRERPIVYQDGDNHANYFMVPLRTSRGKAGGLNFAENYLFEYIHGQEHSVTEPVLKHSLFSIADARHQFQPDFFHETIPFFVKNSNQEIDIRVAFTQSPQFFPEMSDDTDYLDTNNANFFRLNCLLRNCAGGVSSCGTNGTWLLRDRRAGFKGIDSVWEDVVTCRNEFVEKLERRFFHESCKVEDTASSLDRVLQGRQSQYVNRRLAYGMAKDPTDYLAAVQRWAEGGVVLSLQTFWSCREGMHMIWFTAFLFFLFNLGLINLTFLWGYIDVLNWADSLGVAKGSSNGIKDAFEAMAGWFADLFVDADIAKPFSQEVYVNMFMEVATWSALLVILLLALFLVTLISSWCHFVPCGRRAKRVKSTRWPVSMAQWARLFISLDNLTYFLWFWTSFYWVFFNYSSVWWKMTYHYQGEGMVLFSFLIQALGWSMVISSSARYRAEQGASANEVFFLSITNIWRSTQLFYITAPLVLYSIIVGFSDFIRNRMLDVDISYWVGGDRGAVSKSIAQGWTLTLVLGAIISHIFFWSGLLPDAQVGGLIIVTFIALDVLHPCAFLWLGVQQEPLPAPPSPELPGWQRVLRRGVSLMLSMAFYRNVLRGMIFAPRTGSILKWMGPVQNLVFPVITWVVPNFGVSQALLLLASSRT